jgi:tetratricopeptide (TPR) repeat protein
MGAKEMEKIAARYVGVGVSTYDNFSPLPKAVTEVRAVGELLCKGGYQSRVVEDPDKSNIFTSLDSSLPKGILKKGGALVIYWSGHGEVAPEGKLHLVLKDGESLHLPLITPEHLAGQAARSGANQILLLVDVCYAGRGIFSAGNVASDVLRALPPDNPNVWIGVVASAQEYEPAKDGVFGATLLKLLKEGPAPDPDDTSLLHRWSEKNEGVTADDLIYTLFKEWKEEQQRPENLRFGTANCTLLIPNPRFRPNAPDQVVEHLLLASRGVAPGEDGLFFTGRADQLARVVAWMQAGKPEVLVITGPAGCGKSAIAGRIVSLANPDEREQLLARQPLEHVDPGAGSVHAHVYARGLTAEGFCQQIDEQLVRLGVLPRNPGGPRNKWELIGAVEKLPDRLVLVVDGLEEAGAEAWPIAEEVIRLLATKCLVLVSSRELPPRVQGGLSLLQTLVASRTIDLGDEALQEETRRDVRRYVEKRLAGISGQMEPARIAGAIVQIAQEEQEGLFLLARVITSQIRDTPVDTNVPGWEEHLDRSIGAAFDRELAWIPPLSRDGRQLPQAAWELLNALAWAYGSGLPDDLWPIVATALSPEETVYQRDDVFWLLGQAGRYVVEGEGDGRAVYRLAHQRFGEHLRPKVVNMEDRTREEAVAVRIAPALVNHYLRLLAQGQPPQSHSYLWKYAWRHCVDARGLGIAALRELTRHEPESFRTNLAMALNNLGNRYSEVGRRQEAVAWTEEAVAIRREQAASNPAILPNLAGALSNLGNRYSEVGRWQEAVAPAEEAVEVYSKLAKTNPTFQTDLAGALNNLGNRYSEVGRRQEAVGPTEEAVAIYRELAASNPAFRPDQAMALNNLGNRYSEVGRRQESVAPCEEAVAIRRELAATNPAFQPNLAMALNNLGNNYSKVGRWEEAVAPTEQAVEVFRELAKTNPAFRSGLASALNNLGIRYSEVGRRREAVASAEEAVTIRRELAATNPVFQPDLASALSNLGNHYSEVGRRQEAVTPTEEAVTAYRELAATNPIFQPDLAGALSNLGNRYRKVGRREEAVALTEEAVAALRDLTRHEPESFKPGLAMVLNNLGNCYSEVGWRPEAVAPTEEAVVIRRELAATNPAFQPGLASALNNLGIRYSEVGRRKEAVAPSEEAVEIFRELAATNPAFWPDLAGALNNLGIRYREVGRDDLIDGQWNRVISSQEDPLAQVYLLISRADHRPAGDLAAIGDLLAARALLPEEEGGLGQALKEICRQRRSHDPAAFDAQWRKVSEQNVPLWLLDGIQR